MKKKFLKNNLFYFVYKLSKIYRNNKPSIHYGEFAEDVFINRLFKDNFDGTYVDVGCYHPFKGSLTARLYKKNWNGINIDISKTSIDLFKMVRKRDINLNVAISDFDGETSYFENSLINQQNSLIKKDDKQNEVKIECLTLNTVLKKNNFENFDYLNIDVEGSELNVIKGINLKKYRPILITIENNELQPKEYFDDEVCKILIDNDYVFINKIGVTNFFMTSDTAKQISNLIKI